MRLIREQGRPLLLAEIHSLLVGRVGDVAFSTTYRLVKALEQQQFLEHVDWRDRGGRYELVGSHHHHLVCTRCGVTQDLDHELLSFDLEKVARETGFHISRHVLELEGLCASCSSKERKKVR